MATYTPGDPVMFEAMLLEDATGGAYICVDLGFGRPGTFRDDLAQSPMKRNHGDVVLIKTFVASRDGLQNPSILNVSSGLGDIVPVDVAQIVSKPVTVTFSPGGSSGSTGAGGNPNASSTSSGGGSLGSGVAPGQVIGGKP